MSTGKVYLVGAGPGDPGLLTLRGRECLEQADVVLYDDLVDRRLLRFVRSGAEAVAMGKRGDVSRRDRQQAAIDERMITEARAGRTVVRLKGGDPFVFGRGGEEASALVEAGIPFEIVPGVTSAVAVPAYAGIPVTHRGWNSSVTIVTGHEAPGVERHLDWDALAKMETLVFLMGIRRLEAILSRLVAGGRSPDTPAACIRYGTRPDQRVVVGTLADLAAKVAHAGLGPPAVIVVGEVVRLRDRLRWFENRPLFGRRVLLTRTVEQSEALRERLERVGAETIDAAAIEIAPPDDPRAVDRTFDELASYEWIVFTSRNGVRIFWEGLVARGDARRLEDARIAAIGPSTAEELRARGLRVDVVPEEFHGDALAEELVRKVAGARVLLARAAGGREVLPRRLREAGAQVTDLALYRTVAVGSLSEKARRALRDGDVDVVTFTSASTVEGFLDRIAEEGLSIGSARVACIGPVTAEAARKRGLRVDVEALEHTLDGLVRSLVDSFVGGR